ncbi:MAG TPA: hypothetical protein VGA36_05305 [Nitriliruptorales bacterium]
MRRVAVVGPGGAGKSTFADTLGKVTGLPVIHLDRHYWQPGWVPTPDQEWQAVQDRLVAADQWIVDGNYGATFDLRFARADTVIILMPPRTVCLARVLRRWVANRGRAIQAEGCPERVTGEFLRWVWRYATDSRPRLDAALARHPHLQVHEFATRRQAEAFLTSPATADAPSRERSPRDFTT